MSITAAALTLDIKRLGADGDGVAATPGGTLYVPRTLPGERVLAVPAGATRAAAVDILSPSQDRVPPPCPHFARCGGCALQHMADPAYAKWKRDLVAQALRRAGFDDPLLAALARTPPGARRRMDFGARRTPDGITIGLHEAHSETLLDIHECPVLHPALAALLSPLRTLLRGLDSMRRRADIVANLLADGPDLLLRLEAPPSTADRTRLAAFADRNGIGRIACAVGQQQAETAVLLRPPSIRFGNAVVGPPSGAFLQASAEGEAAIVQAVLAGLPKRLTGRARIVELFAGIGTLSFPLATRARVQAYEGNREAVSALRLAAGGNRIDVHHRDLARQPLQKPDFAGAAAVVLDPPFAGAPAQMATLAAAALPKIIYVSCNPAVLTRDAALLRAAGYRLMQATPIDQFVWSARVEAVCAFEKTG